MTPLALREGLGGSLLFFILHSSLFITLASCSKGDGEDPNSEYYNWKSRNDTYFEEIYQKATTEIEAGSTRWMKIMSYSKNNAENHQNYIIVYKLDENEFVEQTSPMQSDSCTLSYRGNMMPSKSYNDIDDIALPEEDQIRVGYQFDTMWYGPSFDAEYATFTTMVPSSLVEGVTTALLHMHAKDRWRVYVPYTLGYKGSETGSVQAYSTLIFDIYMKSFKTKQK